MGITNQKQNKSILKTNKNILHQSGMFQQAEKQQESSTNDK
jgi:hypothetical protein